jgi:Fic family protein
MFIKAQQSSGKLLSFILVKSKILSRASLGLNERQIKVLLRIFEEGVEGFKGGLSAENYISITKTSKATATRDLVDLVEKKVLVKTGKLRYSRYFVNQHFE